MTADRLLEIIKERGGEIVCTQEAFEAIYDEKRRDIEYVGDNDPLKFGGVSHAGVPIYWSRHNFAELMDTRDKYRMMKYGVDTKPGVTEAQ